jgi:glutathione S-transferase
VIPRNGQSGGSPEPRAWVLWASELSPFALKVDALCDHAGLAHRWLPAGGSRLEGLRTLRRVRRLVAGKLPLTFPKMTELDEFPLVPFLLGPDGENLYDSSAIGAWLDLTGRVQRPGAAPLLPDDDPALHFTLRLVDEYFDEFGLYLVHHNRWVVAARDNDAGERLAADFRPILGALAPHLGRRFAARQVRRLPYLFSVAPGDARFDELSPRPRPPARAGFPPTHTLLEERFARLLGILDALLAERPYLFGDRFTLADASAYGQLAMNLSDPSAERWIRRDAPHLRAWLGRVAKANFSASRPEGTLAMGGALTPLFEEICATFVPLMQQNADAWHRFVEAGETRFNEAAFDAGRSLYDGTLGGQPFRSVVKTFQVRVWGSLRAEWDALGEADRTRLEASLPPRHGLSRDGFAADGAAAGGVPSISLPPREPAPRARKNPEKTRNRLY